MGRTSDAKERLMQAAGQLIHERGYNAVGVQDICRQADVKKGSFYHFFDSKADLVLAVLEANLAELDGLLATGAASGQPPLVRLQTFLRMMRERYTGPGAGTGAGPRVFGCPIGNLAVEIGTLDERLRLATAHAFARIQTVAAELLAEAVAAGSLPEHDVQRRAQELVAFMQGAVVLAKAANDPKIVDDFIDRMPAMMAAMPA